MDDPQNPPASSGSKTFVIHKYNPEYCQGSGAQREDRRRGYEDKYEDDALGEELGDDARIWRVMLDEGRANDAAMLQRFRDHLDVDLVFAGLFSAVLTTFVAQTSQTPSDTGDTTIALLLELIAIQRAWANNPRVNDVASFSLPPPSPTPSPWINRCWFLSLIFSLLAAFGAVIVRQWLQEYESDVTGPPKRRALVRHYRRVGLENYKVHLIVPILPMLLHVSLLLFFIGLTLYVRQSDRSMSNGIIALTAMIYLVYLGTNLMPVFRPQCPYRSPLSTGAHWAKSLVALSYALLPAKLRTKALLPAKTVKHRLERTHGNLHDRLRSFREALKDSWKEVFKAPDAHEWEAVLDSSDTMIPDSLDSMAQASSDLSVTPLVVQASSGLPIDHSYYDGYDFEDPRYKELLRRRILPWFTNALSTRRMVFDWAPDRENELQRMACALLLVPLGFSSKSTRFTVLWEQIDTKQYHTCISRVLQALTSALLELPSTPTSTTTDVATLSMTLLALGNRLDDLDRNSKLLKDGALFDTITAAFSSLHEPLSLAVLRLRPVIWRQALTYLRYRGRSMDNTAHFTIALWRSAYSEAPFPDNDNRRKEDLATLPHVTLQEWLYLHPDSSEYVAEAMYRLLSPRTCDSDEAKLSDAFRLHMTCHAIDSYIGDSANPNTAFDENLGFLAVQFVGLLVTTLGYESIEHALHSTGNSAASAAFRSTFVVRPCLSLAMSVKVDTRLPATLAVSLFWLLAKLAEATVGADSKAAVLRVLNRLATDYCDVLTEALDYDKISIDLLLDLASVVLDDPRLGILAIPDALAASLTTQLIKVTSRYFSNPSFMGLNNQPAGSGPRNLHAFSMHHCLYLDALCAARANSWLVDKKFPDASRKLHSTLLSLKSTYHGTWKSELTWQLKQNWVPLAVALALKDSHGCKALAEWVDDSPTLVQDPSSGVKVEVPRWAGISADLDWHRLFSSDPDKYIQLSWMERPDHLPISELVSFDEAVERMQKSDAERAAREAQRGWQGDGSDIDANDDADSPGREHDRVEDQGDGERTQSKITERLRTLGAWVVAPLQRVRPFLVGGRNRSSSIVLCNIDVDVERDAGTSVAPDPERRGGNPPTPARESQGGQDDGTSLAVHDDERARDGEQDQDSSQGRENAHAQDDERSQGEEVPHVQRCQTPDEAVGSDAREDVGTDAREDVEHGGDTSARGTPDAGGGGEQGHEGEQVRDGVHGQAEEQVRGGEHGQAGEHDQTGEPARGDEQVRGGEHGWGDAQDRDGTQDLKGEQDQNSAQSQAHEVPHAQTQETGVELRARDDTVDEGEH
ncbi:hypothetical protein EV715DRAFT_214620 [Schizophyllum commune]